MTDHLKLGYEKGSGEPVDIPLFHTVVTGITRHGKSVTMDALAQRANAEGYTILIFDVKNPRDYAGAGEDIPIYLEEHTDPTTLKGLLENEGRMGLNFQFSELIKMYEPGDTYDDILARMKRNIEEGVHPVTEDKLTVLVHLLSNLSDELDRVTISDDLQLTEGAINVMDLHEVADSIQQLAVAGSVEKVLENHQDVIIILDEAHNFIPQRKAPPARDPLVKAIREGAANSNWLWISDQTITGVDKDPLKQVGVWILGKQREKNEAKRVLDQIPGSTSYGTNDVMTLEKGHFIVALDDAQPHTYVQPTWLDDIVAREIATEAQEVTTLETPKQEVDTMDEELQQKEAELQEKDQRIADLEDQLSAKQAEIEALEEKVDQLFEEDTAETSGGDAPKVDAERVQELVDERIREIEVPDGVQLDTEVPALEIRRVVEPLHLDDSSTKGRVATLYAERVFPQGEWFSTGDLQTWFEERGWAKPSPNTSVLDEFVQWGYLEKEVTDRRKYRVKLTPEEAEEKGLLSFEEVVA